MKNISRTKKIKIGVIGLGYVGTPLALSFSRYFDVVGYDKNEKRIIDLKNKKDSTKETNTRDFILAKKIFFTNNDHDLKDCNIFIVTVPTPVNSNNKPDFSYLLKASRIVGSCLKKGDIDV